MSRMPELDEDKEEVVGAVTGYGGNKVVIMSIFIYVGWLVSCHSVISHLLFLLLNRIILPCLSIL